jgi:hypothetical protein
MANLCDTALSIQSDDEIKDDVADALRKEIEDTILYDGELHFERCDADLIECSLCTRWNVPTHELQAMAKKYAVNIRAVGREDGMGFVQVVCINSSGKIVQSDEIDYEF